MRTYYLYALTEPNVKIPKYIGITNNPKERLRKHLEDKSITKKTKWINSLREGGKLPRMVILKATNDVNKVIDWEMKTIAYYKDKYELTNGTEGGEYYGIGSAIDVYTLDGEYVDSYDSMTEYCESNNLPINFVSAISLVCRRERNYAKDHIFRYKGDTVTGEDLERLHRSLCVNKYRHFYVLTLEGDIYKEYHSCMDAERDGFAPVNRIIDCLNNPERNCSLHNYLLVEDLNNYKAALSNYLRHKQKNNLGQWICQYSLDGKYLNHFATMLEAAHSIGVNHANGIRLCLQNKQNMAHNYMWKYSMDTNDIPKYIPTKAKNTRRYVLQYDLNNNLLNTFDGLTPAAASIGRTDGSGIATAIRTNKTAYGYIWKYGNAVS